MSSRPVTIDDLRIMVRVLRQLEQTFGPKDHHDARLVIRHIAHALEAVVAEDDRKIKSAADMIESLDPIRGFK